MKILGQGGAVDVELLSMMLELEARMASRSERWRCFVRRPIDIRLMTVHDNITKQYRWLRTHNNLWPKPSP